MKKTLYLMRHGQTLFNVEHKIQGWCDSPLTEQLNKVLSRLKLLHAILMTTRLPLITAMQVQVNVHVIRLKLSLTTNIPIQELKA